MRTVRRYRRCLQTIYLKVWGALTGTYLGQNACSGLWPCGMVVKVMWIHSTTTNTSLQLCSGIAFTARFIEKRIHNSFWRQHTLYWFHLMMVFVTTCSWCYCGCFIYVIEIQINTKLHMLEGKCNCQGNRSSITLHAQSSCLWRPVCIRLSCLVLSCMTDWFIVNCSCLPNIIDTWISE